MSESQSTMIQLRDKFQVTGYSHKPFYKLSSQEATALGAKQNKNLIFFKGVLIKGNSPNSKKAIMDMDWVRKRKDLWPGRPITIGHPVFDRKKLARMNDQQAIDYMLKEQEPHTVGRIMKIQDNASDPNLLDFYGYLDQPDLVKGLENETVQLPRYGSPYMWAMGEVTAQSFDSAGNFLVKDHMPIHWAFVDIPAMGPAIELKSACSGEEAVCLQKMLSNSEVPDISLDSQYNPVVLGCPCDSIKGSISETVDKSFYVKDPLSFSEDTMSQENKQEQQSGGVMGQNQSPDKAWNDDQKNFLGNVAPSAAATKDRNEDNKKQGGQVDPTNKPDNHQEQQQQQQQEKKQAEETPAEEEEEKTKLETLIEETRAKEAKSQERRFSKLIEEKDSEINKLKKENAELRFNDTKNVIYEAYPDDVYGTSEDAKKKAAEDREFIVNLAKTKGLTKEEVEKWIGTSHHVMELKITAGGGGSGGSGSSSGKKGQSNSAADDNNAAFHSNPTDAIREYYLSPGAAPKKITNSQEKSEKDKQVREFLGFK